MLAFSQLYLIPSLNKICFTAQHDKHNPNQFVNSGKDGHFIRQPLVSSFVEIGPEEIVADDNPRGHEPDYPS